MNHIVFLKRILLFFWAVWLSVVFLSNLADAAKALGWLREGWAFTSGNFQLIQQTTARYGTPHFVNAVLFAGVLLWQGLAAVLFWRASLSFRGKNSRHKIYSAFTSSLLLWGAFVVADEVLIAYPLESTHLRLFIAQLVTLLAIEMLPEG